MTTSRRYCTFCVEGSCMLCSIFSKTAVVVIRETSLVGHFALSLRWVWLLRIQVRPQCTDWEKEEGQFMSRTSEAQQGVDSGINNRKINKTAFCCCSEQRLILPVSPDTTLIFSSWRNFAPAARCLKQHTWLLYQTFHYHKNLFDWNSHQVKIMFQFSDLSFVHFSST